jgi:hypothetical protein
VAAGAVGEEVELLFLDAVFHFSPSTVKLLVEGSGGDFAAGQVVTTKRGLGPLSRCSALAMTRRLRRHVLRVR